MAAEPKSSGIYTLPSICCLIPTCYHVTLTVMHPPGTFNYANGDAYEGHWVNDTMHGQGVEHWARDQLHTTFQFSWSVTWTGTLKYASGDVYQGNWEENKQNGLGTVWTAAKLEHTPEYSTALSDDLLRIHSQVQTFFFLCPKITEGKSFDHNVCLGCMCMCVCVCFCVTNCYEIIIWLGNIK